MSNIKSKLTRNIISYFALLAVVLCAMMAAPGLSRANRDGTTISLTNNSSRRMEHVYLSATDVESWGADQLNDASLRPGQSFTLSNVSCASSEVKVIAEDQDGCFVSTVVTCTENTSWDITNELTPDCGN
jgi:hypothetical protein